MDLANQSDSDILTRIANGDKELYRLIMDRHASLVFHVIYKYDNDPNRAVEMAHEIFLKAYERLPSFQGNSAFSSWLYRLAHNYCIDQSRKDKYRNTIFTELPDDHSGNLYAEEPAPDDGMITDEQTGQLQKALNKISDILSVPLLMKYRDGLSYEVMSEALNVPVGALKVRVHRARKELKKHLEYKL